MCPAIDIARCNISAIVYRLILCSFHSVGAACNLLCSLSLLHIAAMVPTSRCIVSTTCCYSMIRCCECYRSCLLSHESCRNRSDLDARGARSLGNLIAVDIAQPNPSTKRSSCVYESGKRPNRNMQRVETTAQHNALTKGNLRN